MANRLAMITASGHAVRCDQCSHWCDDGETLKRYDSVALGWTDFGVRQCFAAEFIESARGSAAMVVADGEGYTAALYTKPDHGCAQFEPKEVDSGK